MKSHRGNRSAVDEFREIWLAIQRERARQTDQATIPRDHVVWRVEISSIRLQSRAESESEARRGACSFMRRHVEVSKKSTQTMTHRASNARTLRLASYFIRLVLLPLHDASKPRKSSALTGSEFEPVKSAVFSKVPATRNYHLECPTTQGSKGAVPSRATCGIASVFFLGIGTLEHLS